jgi:hypothetical protein
VQRGWDEKDRLPTKAKRGCPTQSPLNFPLVQYRSDNVAVKFHAAQQTFWRRQFCRHNLSDGFAPLGYDKRLAGTRHFVQKRETMGFKMSGRHGFGLLFHGQILWPWRAPGNNSGCVFLHTWGVEKNTFLIAQPASFSISSLTNSIT